MLNNRKQFVIVIGILLVFGFFITSIVSYRVSRTSLRLKIDKSELPLTSDNIFSEIQQDLLRPIFISSQMATDTFLRDWVLEGEKEETEIRKYLKEIQSKFNTVTSFFVSDKTLIYYHSSGILKKVEEENKLDKWYYRIKKSKKDFETNVDADMANKDTMTIFVNHKVFDYDGNFIGAIGVGLTVSAVKKIINHYQKKYHRQVYFVDKSGKIVLEGQKKTSKGFKINSRVWQSILSSNRKAVNLKRNGDIVHLNSRFISQLNWYLIVEQTEEPTTKAIFKALVLNLLFCTIVTIIVIWLINFTLKVYRKKLDHLVEDDAKLRKINLNQEEEISKQNKALLEKNAELQKALDEVKTLSGFIPICASCKNIRDDKGYWNQLEAYIQEHSDAKFSHGICPDCAKKLYPEIYEKEKE